MSLKTEGRRAGEFVIHEESQDLSREPGVLVAGQNLQDGTVLGKITASGKLTQLAPGASDGSQNFAGILRGDVDATDADTDVMTNTHLTVARDSNLVWPDGITTPQKTAALTAMLTALVKVK